METTYQDAFKWTSDEISLWLSEHKVLFVTNSLCEPGTTYLASMRTYLDYIPVHNFYIVPGMRNGQPYYGLSVFNELSMRALSEPIIEQFDYMVYIDDDCFITDFPTLMKELVRFVEVGIWCMAGPQDGGMIAHRNHSHILFNTYISFWNFKMLRQKSSREKFMKTISQISANPMQSYTVFKKMLQEDMTQVNLMESGAQNMIHRGRLFRENAFPKNEETGEYETFAAGKVRNDPSNPVEPHQTPYTYKENEQTNYEPYYLIEETWLIETRAPIMYLFHQDLYNRNIEDNADPTGVTSGVYDEDGYLYAVHTWFSRAYTKWPQHKLQMEHTRRINNVILKYGIL